MGWARIWGDITDPNGVFNSPGVNLGWMTPQQRAQAQAMSPEDQLALYTKLWDAIPKTEGSSGPLGEISDTWAEMPTAAKIILGALGGGAFAAGGGLGALGLGGAGTVAPGFDLEALGLDAGSPGGFGAAIDTTPFSTAAGAGGQQFASLGGNTMLDVPTQDVFQGVQGMGADGGNLVNLADSGGYTYDPTGAFGQAGAPGIDPGGMNTFTPNYTGTPGLTPAASGGFAIPGMVTNLADSASMIPAGASGQGPSFLSQLMSPNSNIKDITQSLTTPSADATTSAAKASALSKVMDGTATAADYAKLAALAGGVIEGATKNNSSTVSTTYPSWYTEGAQAAVDAAKNIGGYTPYVPNTDRFMNPYITGALDPAAAQVNKTYDNLKNQQQAKASMVGAFGGSRSTLADGTIDTARGTALDNIYGPGYATAYNNAQSLDVADQNAARNWPITKINALATAVRGSGDAGKTQTTTPASPSITSGLTSALGLYSAADKAGIF